MEPTGSQSWEDVAKSWEDQCRNYCNGEGPKIAAQSMNSRDLQGVLLKYLIDYWLVHVCEEATRDQVKNYHKRLQRRILDIQSEWKRLFPSARMKNLMTHGTLVREQKELGSVSENN